MKLCIFCSANEHIDPDYFTATEQLGRWAAMKGHTIVFGGNDSGLMHAVSKAAKDAGGRLIGVVPRKIEEMGHLSPYLDVHIPTEDLADRKALMQEQADAFIVLPGGVGTLDEVFTVAATRGLDYHRKPIILYNMKGFWNALIHLLDDLTARGVWRGHWHDQIAVADSLDDIERLLATQA